MKRRAVKSAHAVALFLPFLVAQVRCAPDLSIEAVTPRERLCAIEGWSREYFRDEAFPVVGVAVTVDKDIGLPETTVHSDAHGRLLFWDAKCGSRAYTVTATDRLGRQVTVQGQQPADLGRWQEGLQPRYRLFSWNPINYPISPPTVEQWSVEIVGYQTSATGSLIDLVKFPAQVGKEVSILVQYERLPKNGLLTINEERVSPRLLGEVSSTRIREGAHEYRYVPRLRGEYEVRLISYYDDVRVRSVVSFRAE